MTFKLPNITLPTITLEHMVLGLIIAGIPAIAFMWFGWRACATALIVTLIAVGLVKLRYS